MRTIWACSVVACVAACGGSGKSGSSAGGTFLSTSLYFMSDSDGTTAPSPIVLMFEPGGVADLYTADPTTPSARNGQYSLSGTMVSLKFTDADFQKDVQFMLDLTQPMVTLPFAMVSTSASSSTWSLSQDGVVDNVFVVFESAFLSGSLSPVEAADRAFAFATALSSSKSDAPAANPFTVTRADVNALQICFQVGGCILTSLFDWAEDNTLPPGFVLTQSPIVLGDALDEIHLPASGPVYFPTNSDPLEKWALFFIPLKKALQRRYVTGQTATTPDGVTRTVDTVSWDDALYDSYSSFLACQSGDPIQSKPLVPTKYRYADIETFMGNNGYPTVELSDDPTAAGAATVANLIQYLAPKPPINHTHSPGVLLLDTHGTKDGAVLTGDTLSLLNPTDQEKDPMAWKAAFDQFIAGLSATYPDLAAQDSTGEYVNFGQETFTAGGSVDNHSAMKSVHAVFIKPAFWSWLRQKQSADFSRSLVYVGACDTAQSDALATAFGAAAHFGFKAEVPPTSTVLFYSMMQDLVRHTHTAEEGYYNVLRVLRTKQSIYCEDRLIDALEQMSCNPSLGATDPCKLGSREAMAQAFHGYSSTGTAPVDYLNAGWLTDPKPGNIWWLMFKSRWYTASGTAPALIDCWTQYWMNQDTGPSTVSCYDMAPGEAPSQPETGYALYLYDADSKTISTSLPLIPRWTWNDGNQ